jgi:hypothetical protein
MKSILALFLGTAVLVHGLPNAYPDMKLNVRAPLLPVQGGSGGSRPQPVPPAPPAPPPVVTSTPVKGTSGGSTGVSLGSGGDGSPVSGGGDTCVGIMTGARKGRRDVVSDPC